MLESVRHVSHVFAAILTGGCALTVVVVYHIITDAIAIAQMVKELEYDDRK